MESDMFIIVEGTVKLERRGKPLGKLRELDIFGELGVLLEAAPGFPIPRLRSAYALVPNTLVAMLTAHDLQKCRHESPAINHAVEVCAAAAALRHPSLHPTRDQLHHAGYTPNRSGYNDALQLPMGLKPRALHAEPAATCCSAG